MTQPPVISLVFKVTERVTIDGRTIHRSVTSVFLGSAWSVEYSTDEFVSPAIGMSFVFTDFEAADKFALAQLDVPKSHYYPHRCNRAIEIWEARATNAFLIRSVGSWSHDLRKFWDMVGNKYIDLRLSPEDLYYGYTRLLDAPEGCLAATSVKLHRLVKTYNEREEHD